MDFLRTWLTGYYNPSRAIEKLKGEQAPHYGFIAVLLRGLLDAFFLYIPLALLGKEPSFPSWLTFISLADYYKVSILLIPVFLFDLWLLISVSIHLILKLLNYESDIDQLLNIIGLASLVVGTFLILWDWTWIAFGWHNPVSMGISHLIFSFWNMAIVVLGLKKILSVPVKLAVVLGFVSLSIGLPLSMIFVRPPV